MQTRQRRTGLASSFPIADRYVFNVSIARGRRQRTLIGG